MSAEASCSGSSVLSLKLNYFSFISYADDVLTKCERHVQKSLVDGSQFVPRCKRDGTYEDVQCDGSSAECWCVNKDGKELLQTRSKDPVKCVDQSK